MKTKAMIRQIEKHVTGLFDRQTNPGLLYHSLTHTQYVVKAVEQLSSHYKLSKPQHLTVIAAAWFHDVGYLLSTSLGHEAKGADAAVTFLTEINIPASVISHVQACILATLLPQSPSDLLEQILCDADLFHLGSKNFAEKNKLLREEQQQLSGQDVSPSAWRDQTIQFMQSQTYFTDYALKQRQKEKEINLKRLLAEQLKKSLPIPSETAEQDVGASIPQANSEKIKKGKESKPERGIETMFRMTSSNHLRLSDIADSKANLMISVNAIMVSVIISVLSHRFDQYPYLLPPTALFLTTALLTIIFSVLATRPKITEGRFSLDDIQQKRSNLLFFGNFYNMSLADYEAGITAMMKDSDFLYGSMMRDIYYLGVVLSHKYKLLRIAYNIFMFGFVLSILLFLLVFLLNR